MLSAKVLAELQLPKPSQTEGSFSWTWSPCSVLILLYQPYRRFVPHFLSVAPSRRSPLLPSSLSRLKAGPVMGSGPSCEQWLTLCATFITASFTVGYLTTALTAGPAGPCDCALHWAQRWGLTPTLDKGVRGVQWLFVCVYYGSGRRGKKRDAWRRSVKGNQECVWRSVRLCDGGLKREGGAGDMAARLRWNRWIRLAELSDRSITIKLSAQCLPLSALSFLLINRGIGLQFGLVLGQPGSLPCLSAAFSALWKEHKKGTNLPGRALRAGQPAGGPDSLLRKVKCGGQPAEEKFPQILNS